MVGHNIHKDGWKAKEHADKFPEELHDKFMGEKTWACSPPFNFFTTAQSTSNIVKYMGDTPKLHQVWLSQLCEPKTMLIHRENKQLRGLVMSTSDHGVLLWLGTHSAERTNADYHFSMEPKDKTEMWKQIEITDVDKWLELQMAAIPPCAQRNCRPTPVYGDTHGVYLAAKDGCDLEPLPIAAAKKALFQSQAHRANIYFFKKHHQNDK